ncbi:Bxi1p [Rhodotorula paludigena]|uniref:Bxi1p n=1 Tax=Rhodotorula paludigena TaxID=86838 RepID=UPI00316EA5F1
MSSSQGYTVEPPSYTPAAPAPPAKKGANAYGATAAAADAAHEPLLAPGEGHAARDAWGEDDDGLDDDFKIGVTVSQSAQSIRHAFVSKVYGVLFCQILLTTVVGWVMSANESISLWTHEHSGLMLLPAFGAIVAMLAVYWKRHSSPANVILLGFFTLLEAVTLGSVVALFDSGIVLQAFVITTLVFLGLTVFTFQTKYDFSSMGSYLYATLLVFFFTSLVGVFLPFNRTFDLVVAGAGTLLFSLYIVFDTQMILNRLHVDDWVVACVSLYLDIVNLFLQILRILSDVEER